MKKGLKWLLGIVIGLVIVAALVIGALVVFNHFRGSGVFATNRSYRFSYNQRVMPWQNMPGLTRPPERNFVRPFVTSPFSRIGMFRPLSWLFGCLVCLGFIILVVLGVVYLIRGPRRAQQSAVSPAPMASPAATAAPSAPVQATVHACPHCGQMVQDDWKHCPHCGGPLSESAQTIPPAS